MSPTLQSVHRARRHPQSDIGTRACANAARSALTPTCNLQLTPPSHRAHQTLSPPHRLDYPNLLMEGDEELHTEPPPQPAGEDLVSESSATREAAASLLPPSSDA